MRSRCSRAEVDSSCTSPEFPWVLMSMPYRTLLFRLVWICDAHAVLYDFPM